jgi:hypothetical protein
VTDPNVKQVGGEAVVGAYNALHEVTVTVPPDTAVQPTALVSKPVLALPDTVVAAVHEMQAGVVEAQSPYPELQPVIVAVPLATVQVAAFVPHAIQAVVPLTP